MPQEQSLIGGGVKNDRKVQMLPYIFVAYYIKNH